MPIQHAVLALLAEGKSHGYELKQAFERAIGPQWGSLNIGHLYQILDRLEREDLVRSRHVPQADRPDRQVYQLTPAGRAELSRWLSEPSIRSGGYRDDFFIKVMAAARAADPTTLPTVLANQRAYLLAALRDLLGMGRERDDDPVVGLLITAARLHVEADLAFVDEVEAELHRRPPSGSGRPGRRAGSRRPGRRAGSGRPGRRAGAFGC